MTEVWSLGRPGAAGADSTGGSIALWAGRGLTSCLDQGVVSGVSFAVNVLLARWLSSAGYGAFSVAFALFLFVSGFHDALLVDPACVLGPARFLDRSRVYFKKLVYLHGGWSAAASLGVGAIALFTREASLRRAFCGLAVALPFLLLLWLVRRLCYVDGRPVAALLSSAAYASFLAAGFFALGHWTRPSPFTAFLVMAGAAGAASVTVAGRLGLAGGGSRIGRGECFDLARAHWSYGRWLGVASLVTLGVTQLQTFLIAGFLGLESAGAFRAMFNLVQPMNQVTAAAALLFLPHLSADFGAGRTANLRARSAWITAGLVSLSLVYELVLVFWSARLARLLYGGRFAAYHWLIPILGLMPVFIALASGRSLVLQAVQKPQHYLIRGAVTGPVGIASAAIFTRCAGLGGAADAGGFLLGYGVAVPPLRSGRKESTTMTGSDRNGPAVSVLIDNFNYGRFLGAALESVLAQSCPVREIVIADDGSTDDSCRVAERYAARYGNVRLVRKANGGQASAFNAAFANSTGEVLCLLDSDDVWSPRKIARVVEVFTAMPEVEWVRHKLRFADESLSPLAVVVPEYRGSRALGDDRYAHLEKTVTFSTTGLALTRKLAHRLFPIPEATFAQAPDLYLDFMCGILGAPGYSLDEELGLYRRHAAQMSIGGGDFAAAMGQEIASTRAFLAIEPCGGYVPTHLRKHELIAAYLRSGRVVDRQRLRLCAAGLASARRLAREGRRRLALAQTAKLLYGFLLPRSWIGRQRKRSAWGAA